LRLIWFVVEFWWVLVLALAVVVGYTSHFDYDDLTAACRTLRGGARLVGTNDDATYPTPDGLVPGAGSLLAAVATDGFRHMEKAGVFLF